MASAEALFLNQMGVKNLALMIIADALLTALAVISYGVFVDRISNPHLMLWICLLGSLSLAAARLGIEAGLVWVYPLLYLLERMLKALLSIHVWTLMADYYDARVSKRHYPIIISAARVAGILAGVLTLPITRYFTAKNLVLAWAITLGSAAVLVWVLSRRLQPEAQPFTHQAGRPVNPAQNLRSGFQALGSSPFLRVSAAAAVVGALLLYLLEYQSQIIFANRFTSAESLASFYGLLGAASDILMLPLQLFLISRLIARLGVGSASLIFPGISALSYSLLVFVPGLATASLARIDRLALRSTLRAPLEGLLFNAVPSKIKGRARALITGLLAPAGALLAGLLLLALRQGWFSLAVISGIGLAAAGLYLWFSWQVRVQYAVGLVHVLEQEDFSALISVPSDLPLADATTLAWLTKRLEESTDPDLAIFIARLTAEVGGDAAAPQLIRSAQHAAPQVRAAVIELLAQSERPSEAVSAFTLAGLADSSAAVRRAALASLEQHLGAASDAFLAQALPRLSDPDPAVRAQASAPLLSAPSPQANAAAHQTLVALLGADEPEARRLGLRTLQRAWGGQAYLQAKPGAILDPLSLLLPRLADPNDAVRLEAIQTLEAISPALPADRLAALLAAQAPTWQTDPLEAVRKTAVALLGRQATPAQLPALGAFLSDPNPSVQTACVEALVTLGRAALPLLTPYLERPGGNEHKLAIAALCQIEPGQYLARLHQLLHELLDRAFQNLAAQAAVPIHPGRPALGALHSVLGDENLGLRADCLYLLGALHGAERLQRIEQSLLSELPNLRANAVEALEALSDPRTANRIANLYPTQPQLVDSGHTPAQPADLGATLQALLAPTQPLALREIAAYALGETQALLSSAAQANLSALAAQDPAVTVRQAAELGQRAPRPPTAPLASEEADMLSLIERVIFLKQVAFFQNMVSDQLKALAAICEEKSFPADALIFAYGEPGGALYVIVSGQVAIERPGLTPGSTILLATMEARAYFGEMSLFDGSPRSAAARTLTETLVLELRRAPFVALLRQSPDLAFALINVLNQRLRQADNRIAELTHR
jgi:HEAT repeat protein